MSIDFELFRGLFDIPLEIRSGGPKPTFQGPATPLLAVNLQDGSTTPIGFVVSTPNTPREYSLDDDFDFPHAVSIGTRSTETLDRILFAEASEPSNPATLPVEAHLVSRAAMHLGRSNDAIDSCGCGLCAPGVRLFKITRQGVSQYGNQPYFAIATGKDINTDPGFTGVRHIYDQIWTAPLDEVRALTRDEFERIFAIPLADIKWVDAQLAPIVDSECARDRRRRISQRIVRRAQRIVSAAQAQQSIPSLDD